MKIERLSPNKIRIFLTFDDLEGRGIQKDDMWREDPKVHELFSEMMDQAYSEFGFDATGPLAVEVFSLPAQGMVVIVTRGKMLHSMTDEEEDELPDDLYDMELAPEQRGTLLMEFCDFEDVVQAAKSASSMLSVGAAEGAKGGAVEGAADSAADGTVEDAVDGAVEDAADSTEGAVGDAAGKYATDDVSMASSLYSYRDRWFLFVDVCDMEDQQFETLAAVLSEFGEISLTTEAVLQEYGKLVISGTAIATLCDHFS